MLRRLHSIICKTLFTTKPPISATRLPRAFELLATAIKRADEIEWDYGSESYVALSDLIAGAYWYFVENHSGQWSDEYRVACALHAIYTPPRNATGPTPDSGEYEVYTSLAREAIGS